MPPPEWVGADLSGDLLVQKALILHILSRYPTCCLTKKSNRRAIIASFGNHTDGISTAWLGLLRYADLIQLD